jgi:hypothetical protein
MKLKAVRTIVAGVFVMMWTAGAFAYDCSKGGETIATTIQFFYGASATPEAAIWLKGRTSRSLEDTQACPGLIRVEGWIDAIHMAQCPTTGTDSPNWDTQAIPGPAFQPHAQPVCRTRPTRNIGSSRTVGLETLGFL